MNRALRERSTMALLFMDIDGFKGVNDKYGHEAGDEMLVMFAKRLLHAVRDVDTVARLAGDEFIVILEKAHETPDAVAVAEKILQTMREPFVLTAATVSVSTSIGVSIYQPERHETPDPEALVARADKAMYDAKKAGKDRVCVFVESLTV
jgi:diguanylate cyclase (GGDEF)-like protein